MINCPNCGSENENDSKFCIDCGEALIVKTGRRGPRGTSNKLRKQSTNIEGYVEGKDPKVAAVLSLVPGLGQLYNGDSRKGLLLLAGALVLGTITVGIVYLALIAYSGYDAYQVASGDKELGEW